MLNLDIAGQPRAIVRPMRGLVLVLTCLAAPLAAGQAADKELVATIKGPDLKGGVISEVAWDGDTVVLQGAFALPTGELSAQYFVIPAARTMLERREAHTDASLQYWEMKSRRVSPTGLGTIVAASDTSLPQLGIGSLERRIADAHDMGGPQTRTTLRLGKLILLERTGTAPYDGETWSWSPAELNRVAYVDGKGDLWVARADGTAAHRLIRGDFTLPAWSPDGRSIAVAERKDGGRRWEISLIHLPAELRR